MMHELQEDQDFFQQLNALRRQRDHEALSDTLKDLASQKAQGKCALPPLPTVALQPFRSELTVERHPLFVVNSYKGDCFSYQKTIHHPETKEPIVQTVRVGKVNNRSKRSYGVLKESHRYIFCQLLKLWGEQGYPLSGNSGVIESTAYHLVLTLMKDDSSSEYQRLQELLFELSNIPISFENAYTWHGVQDVDKFTLLGAIHWKSRKFKKETLRPETAGTSNVRILLSEFITEGFLRKQVKKLLFHPLDSLRGARQGRRSELACLLYPILDHELSSKDHFHIFLTTMAQRLGMSPQRYRSDRRRPFVSALKLLQGKEILGGKYVLDLRLVDSSDGQDDVLVASKSAYQMTLQGI